jgi:hypothetical protein
MKRILKGIKACLFFFFWPIMTIALNLFLWIFGWWLVGIPPIRRKIDKLDNQERQKWKKIEGVFDSPAVGGTIKAFAEDYNMYLHKYYHDGQDWSLLFARKKGGVGKVQVTLMDAEEKKFNITAMWWVDSWEDEARYSTQAYITEHLSTDDPVELRKKLEATVAQIGRWNKEDLTAHYGFKNWRRTWQTPEEFEKAGRPYRVLDI